MTEDAHKIPYHLRRPDPLDYIRGFVLAVTLTAIPFAIVAVGDISPTAAIIIISALAAVQIGVHLRYFLHYSTKRAPYEVTLALLMSAFMASIMIAGCIWVMSDLNARMMP